MVSPARSLQQCVWCAHPLHASLHPPLLSCAFSGIVHHGKMQKSTPCKRGGEKLFRLSCVRRKVHGSATLSPCYARPRSSMNIARASKTYVGARPCAGARRAKAQ